jgi:DNA-binding CsgD family transcriptional regulator
MEGLRELDWHAGFEFIGQVSEAGDSLSDLAAVAVEGLAVHVACELATLSLCDLKSGRRRVIGGPAGVIGATERAAFDRHFREHPLVRYHGGKRGAGTRRISDSWSMSQFRRTALYAEYYLVIGIDHVVALPLHIDDDTLVSLVLNRRGRDFSDRECLWLDMVGVPLARLYRRTVREQQWRERLRQLQPLLGDECERSVSPGVQDRLTEREREVLRWLAAGKTDRDIADLVHCSHRTVQKHLQRIYVKLGVETRTAAVMRVMASDSR